MGKKIRRPAKPRHFEASVSLFRVCQAMGSTLDLGHLLKLILRLTMEELDAQQGSILLFAEESDQLKMLASRGMPRAIIKKGYMPRKGSIAEWVIEHDRPLLLNDVKDDKRFTSIVRGRPIYSSMCVPLRAKGKVIGTINITRTRRKEFADRDLETLVILASQAAVSIDNARLYEQALRSERLATIGRTVAAISHGAKNMLTGLKGGTSIVQMGCNQKDWAMVQQGYEMVRRNTDRVSTMVLDMLEYSKERSPVRSGVELARLIEDLFSGLSHVAEPAKIRLSSRIEPECQTIYVDGNQLYRALLNLTINAIDAIHEKTSEGGEIEVRAERVGADCPIVQRCLPKASGAYDLISVRDTGTGIPAEYVSELFQPFFSRKGSKGTGLGLAVTRKIAREHGGEATVDSEVGKGSVFILILPVVAPAPNAPAAS